LLSVYRFRQVFRCAGFQTFFTIPFHCLGGECDDRHTAERSILPDHLHRFVAVHFGHHNIHEHDGHVWYEFKGFDSRLTSAGGEHAHTPALENTAQGEYVSYIVIHDQHFSSHQGVVGSMQPIKHVLFLRGKVGDHAMQE
jgi:hypothetical protein